MIVERDRNKAKERFKFMEVGIKSQTHLAFDPWQMARAPTSSRPSTNKLNQNNHQFHLDTPQRNLESLSCRWKTRSTQTIYRHINQLTWIVSRLRQTL